MFLGVAANTVEGAVSVAMVGAVAFPTCAADISHGLAFTCYVSSELTAYAAYWFPFVLLGMELLQTNVHTIPKSFVG